MKLDIIKKIGELYSPLSPTCQKELLENLTIVNHKKGAVVVREGQYAHKSYFILQGCARAYYLKNDKDVSDWFAFENEFISPIVSFFGEEPSAHYIEMVEDTVVMEITKEATENLSNKFHDFERLIKVVVTKTMLNQREKMFSILFNTARERYDHMIRIRPDITNRIQLTHIASYLGMTIETLSRVRSQKI